MLIQYDIFYRRFGVRKASHLTAPLLPVLEMLELPKKSIYHFVGETHRETNPSSNDFLFRHITKPIYVEHVLEAGDVKGNPRRLAVNIEQPVRTFHMKNRRFLRMRNLQSVLRDDNSLLVCNYGFIDQQYRYMRSFYSEFYRWWNSEAAVWSNIEKLANETDRQQFVMLKIPQVLPSISELRLGVNGLSQKFMKIFNDREEWMLLEMWKWLGVERGQSMISAVSEKNLSKVNLIYQESGRWIVVNLGMLNQWRRTPKEELEKTANPIKDGFEAPQLQRRFLYLLMTLSQVRNADPELIKDTAPGNTDKVKAAGEEAPAAASGTAPDSTASAQELEPSDTAQDIKIDPTVEKDIEADLAELEAISKSATGKAVTDEDAPQVVEEEPELTLEEGVKKVCDRLADSGMLSAAEYRRYNELAATYKKLPAPNGQTLEQFIKVETKDLTLGEQTKLTDIKTVVDKSMLTSSLLEFDEKYIRKVFQRDVAGMVLNVQKAGIAVTNYQVERQEDVMGSYDSYAIEVVPVEGAKSTLRFKLPVLEDDGTYTANGVRYRMRKQRGDLPIRKVSSSRVALTSYYGKVFVSRSEKRVNSYGDWLCAGIMAAGLDRSNVVITNLQPTAVFDNLFVCPRAYSAIAKGFRGFDVTPSWEDRTNGPLSFELNFDHTKREKLYGEQALAAYEKEGSVIIGTSDKDHYLVMDKDSNLYLGKDGVLTDYASVETLLGLESEKAPVDFAELKVMGRTIPLGIVLGYEMGLDKLLKELKIVPRRVQAGTRVQLQDHEYAIVFSDESLVFSKDDKLASMILAGFNEYHKVIRQYASHEFDKRGVYLNVLESSGSSVRYLREIDLLYQLFIDPITRDLLVEMNEPVTFHGLLKRSAELLLTDHHPDELDPAFMRIKGYERMAGAVYSELVRSIRSHAARPGKSKLPLDLNPYAVWTTISEDPSKAQVVDINPIQNLKEVEAVTFSGVGGRSSRSMTKRTRIYHKNDMGTISESTVDSSDVGINIYTSANPKFTSVRGISQRFDLKNPEPSSLLSTSALICPGSDRDDPKRVNFIGIQQAHTVACKGYTQMPVRTGYEQVIAQRTSDLFAFSAKKPGRVKSVTDDGMVVEYDDGEVKGIELGRRYGKAAGLTIPHDVITDLKEGQKFKEGELLCYNGGFFERDILNPNNVVWKAGVVVKTALMEAMVTLEDSSAISQRVAELLTTKTTKIKEIVLNFDQSVRRLVKAGDSVEPEDILCVIEDAVTANSELFDETTLDTLRILSAQTPTAKVKGVVERIEVYYHGDKEDMTESLRAIANASDREMAKRYKNAGKKAFTGSVDDSYRVDGEPLAPDTLSIRLYITSDVPAGVGDKGVFCNQMKTVFGQVMTGEVTTETGKVIDAIFGQKSIQDRIVLSPEIIGTTTTLLDVIAKKAIAAYKKA